ncbi:MAG: hypothetical protein MJE77_16110 [Proteobacteria bacterium]|nr:hypothetical protein [Pseudomonadota bacterium]
MPRNKSTANAKRNKSPPKFTIRRNADSADSSTDDQNQTRPSMGERLQELDGAHVGSGVAAGAVGNALGVLVVGLGWLGPKVTAGLLLGTGATATTAGYFLERNHLMAAGTGLAAAGTFSLINQYAVDAYEALDDRDRRKKEEREQEEHRKRLAAARQVSRQANQRNAHLRIVDPGDEFEDAS